MPHPLYRFIQIACILLVTALGGCQTVPENSPWLYQQLGGREGISDINKTLLLTIAKDDRIAPIFQDVDIVRLHRLLTEQFCALSGGPCHYTGANMVEAHRGLDLNSADFNALVEDLVRAMQAHDIPVSAQNRLLAQLAPMRGDIVGSHPIPADQTAAAPRTGRSVYRPGNRGTKAHTAR